MLALLLSVAAQAPTPAPDLDAEVRAYLAPLVASGTFAGAVLIARGDECLVEDAFGFADTEAGLDNTIDTAFKLMSVSKSLCAVALMRMVEEGVLGLDDPVSEHLPAWPQQWAGVTVHDLSDHTSGLPNLEGVWSRAAWGAPGSKSPPRGLDVWRRISSEVSATALEAPPGTRHRYSNFNYELLGAVIESAAKASYGDVLRARVLAPAEMQRTAIDDGERHDGLSIGYFRRGGAPFKSEQDMSRIQAAGGVYSTVRDLWRLDRALASGALLSAEARDTMETARVGEYAVGWSRSPVHGRAAVHHSGGANGYVAYLLRLPDEDACIVALSNLAYAPITRIAYDLAGLLLGEEVARPRAAGSDELDGAVGTFRAERGWPLVVLERSGGLLVAFDVWSPQSERTSGRILVPVAEADFVPAFGDERRRLVDGDLVITRGGTSQVLSRVDDATDAWLERVGSFAAAPAPAPAVEVVAKDRALALVVSPRDQLRVVPVTDDLALTLYDDLGGTLMRWAGGALHWSRPGVGWVELRSK